MNDVIGDGTRLRELHGHSLQINKCRTEKTKERKGKDKNYFLNCKKTKHELNWKTTMNLDQGLKISINYYDKIVKYINKKDINNNIKF